MSGTNHDSPQATAFHALKALEHLPIESIGLHIEIVRVVRQKLNSLHSARRKNKSRQKKLDEVSEPLRIAQPQPRGTRRLISKDVTSSSSKALRPEPYSPQPSPVVVQLMRGLNHARTEILNDLKDPAVEAAITKLSDCFDDDPRYLDLVPSTQTPITRGKKLHARRWVAMCYEQWMQDSYRRSRVEELLKNPKGKTKLGTFDEFFKSGWCKLKDTDVARKGLSVGLRLLVLERLCGWDAVSAVVNYQASGLRDTNMSELEPLSLAIKSSDWIMKFVQDRPGWLTSRQERYDGSFGPSSKLAIRCVSSSPEIAVSQPSGAGFEEQELEGMRERSNAADPELASSTNLLHHNADIAPDLRSIAGQDVHGESTQNETELHGARFVQSSYPQEWVAFEPRMDSHPDILHHSTGIIPNLQSTAGQDFLNDPQYSMQNESESLLVQPPYPENWTTWKAPNCLSTPDFYANYNADPSASTTSVENLCPISGYNAGFPWLQVQPPEYAGTGV